MIVLMYLLFVILVTILGNQKQIGAGLTFALALFLSPLIALIFVLISKDKQMVTCINSVGKEIEVDERTVFDGAYFIKQMDNGYCLYQKQKDGNNQIYYGMWNECIDKLRDIYSH